MGQRFAEWLDDVSSSEWIWLLKRLSANDTGASGGHQVGLYVPEKVIKVLFGDLARETTKNPKRHFTVSYESAPVVEREVVVTWYNNEKFGGTRNEFRFTNWGGKDSPLQDPEATGAACLLAFSADARRDRHCRVWVCSGIEEEDELEARVGEIAPGEPRLFFPGGDLRLSLDGASARRNPCELAPSEIPPEWLAVFPKTEEFVRASILRSGATPRELPDRRLVRRRECEYSLFLSVEREVVLPQVQKGFPSVDAFVEYSGQVMNRRKSRSGRSLELHLMAIFNEEQLRFDHGKPTEQKKTPDFLFPSAAAYHDRSTSAERLRMLGAKTTCKDRWRQVVTEARRIERKHLLTLQEGVSQDQHREMEHEGIVLVVPEPLHRRYPESVRKKLVSLDEFIAEVRELQRAG